MTTSHLIVWIDHRDAHIIHFSADDSERQVIKTTSTHPHLYHKRGEFGSGKAPFDGPYFDEVIKAIMDAKEILIVGPGSAKLELVKEIHKKSAELVNRIVGIETVDHPTDPQLLAYAKHYFVRIDRMI
jgi:stalled ribosome rescue protein Dom34